MTAFNVVRFRVRPGRDEDFINAHRAWSKGKAPKGARKFSLIKTGEGSYCAVGEWGRFGDIVAARPAMIGALDTMRDMLEDLGGGMGVTDPVSGTAVFEMSGARAPKARDRAKEAAPRKAAKKMTKRKTAARKPAKKRGRR